MALESMHRRSNNGQCRSPGTMMVAFAGVSSARQYSSVSAMPLGCAKILGCVQIRTTDASTWGDIPNAAGPLITSSSQLL